MLLSLTTAGVYGGVLKDAVFALKYHHRQAVAPALAALLVPIVLPLLCSGDVLIPVPLHPDRLRERGYNQATMLATALADAAALAGLPDVRVRDDLIRRVRPTADQTRLGPAQRRANMAGAFATVSGQACVAVQGRMWLIDDVLTTGATLHACATALATVNSSVRIHGLALARAPGFHAIVPRVTT